MIMHVRMHKEKKYLNAQETKLKIAQNFLSLIILTYSFHNSKRINLM